MILAGQPVLVTGAAGWPMQPGDVPLTYADTSKLQEWVGFAPATPLREGLGRFGEWLLHWMAHKQNA